MLAILISSLLLGMLMQTDMTPGLSSGHLLEFGLMILVIAFLCMFAYSFKWLAATMSIRLTTSGLTAAVVCGYAVLYDVYIVDTAWAVLIMIVQALLLLVVFLLAPHHAFE